MGQPKLLMPLGEQTVLARVLQVLRHPAIQTTVVVTRRADTALAAAVHAGHAELVQPAIDPPDMRSSVQHALDHLRQSYQPLANDGWLLIPADHPLLDPQLLAALVARWQTSTADILLPTHAGRSGHPTIFRWSLAEQVPSIPADQGLNWLVRQPQFQHDELSWPDPAILQDLDTPEDYDRLRSLFSAGSAS